MRNENDFPISCVMLKQECFIILSNLNQGLENLVKGNFDDAYQRYFYGAFFNISIAIERLLKVCLVSNDILTKVQNNETIATTINLKQYGHDLLKLYTKSIELCEQNNIILVNFNDLNNEIISFFNDFAKIDRYYNLDNITPHTDDTLIHPMEKFKKLLDKVGKVDVKKSMLQKIIQKAGNNPFYQQMSLAIENFEYMEIVKHYVKWRIVEILQPKMKLLKKFSDDLHLIETTASLANYPTFPYYDEFFVQYVYTTKSRILRRRKFN